MFRLLTVVLLLFSLGCEAPAPKTRASGTRTAFSTSDPSRLFFLNTRVSNYYRERPKGTELDLYRYRKFSQTDRRPLLIPVIIHAWMKGEAYVFIRPNKYPHLADPLTIQSADSSGTSRYMLEIPSRPAQVVFAEHIYNDIRAGKSLAVQLKDSTFVPIYESRAERAAYLAVMRDYFRLTDRI